MGVKSSLRKREKRFASYCLSLGAIVFKLEGILFLRCMFMDNIYRGDIPRMADLWGSAFVVVSVIILVQW